MASDAIVYCSRYCFTRFGFGLTSGPVGRFGEEGEGLGHGGIQGRIELVEGQVESVQNLEFGRGTVIVDDHHPDTVVLVQRAAGEVEIEALSRGGIATAAVVENFSLIGEPRISAVEPEPETVRAAPILGAAEVVTETDVKGRIKSFRR